MPAGMRVGLLAALLPGHPAYVPLHGLVSFQCLQGVQALGECHLVEQAMQTGVAGAAKLHAGVQLFARKILAKARAPMHLAGNQVMKGQRGVTIAEFATALLASWHHYP